MKRSKIASKASKATGCILPRLLGFRAPQEQQVSAQRPNMDGAVSPNAPLSISNRYVGRKHPQHHGVRLSTDMAEKSRTFLPPFSSQDNTTMILFYELYSILFSARCYFDALRHRKGLKNDPEDDTNEDPCWYACMSVCCACASCSFKDKTQRCRHHQPNKALSENMPRLSKHLINRPVPSVVVKRSATPPRGGCHLSPTR